DEIDRMLFECGCRKSSDTNVSEFENAPGLSIGIVWADKPAVAQDMFAQADAALYDAKRAGKNRFEITRNMGIASE
ncbi:MAG: diguanylate cyclase, partial [Clostridiales bacterium]|nr:diguanylate cyclase [Clostridiales bacterium]